MMNLSLYQQDTAAILHDQAFLFTSPAQLNRWINEARRQVAKRTGCVRRLITGQSAFGASAQPGHMIAGGIQPGALPNALPDTQNGVAALNTAANTMQTIVGVERYPYQGFFNPLLKAQYAGLRGVIDTIEVAINWGGNFRPSLTWMPWDDFQAYCRAYSNQTTSYPAVWSVFNDGEYGEIWLFPTPSQANEIEADVSCIPADLYSNDDFEALPEGVQDAVKYKAASLAFLVGQRYAQAEAMENMFASTLGIDMVAIDRGKTPNYYFSRF